MQEKRKPGRPKGAQNKVGQNTKQILEALAEENLPIVQAKLQRMAGSKDPDVNELYLKTVIDICKFVVPKPVDINAHVADEDFQTLYQRWQAAADPEE